jgi:hypothetical protein
MLIIKHNNETELKHHGVKGMRWGHRKKTDYAGEGSASMQKQKKPIGRTNPNAGKPTLGTKIKNGIRKRSTGELANRGKSAIDVLMNGDKDWMGSPVGSDDAVTEARNRGKAALERLMYSQQQINNKKFFGSYNPFG